MTELAIFDRNVNVRISYINKDPWFVAQDICDALGLSNVSKALENIDEDEKQTIICDITVRNTTSKARRTQKLLHINESGLYSLIFRSRKPEAVQFRKWVTKEVLPTIRKTGSFSLENRSSEWLSARIEGKNIRKEEVLMIKTFCTYATKQGSKSPEKYYIHFTNAIYKTLGVVKGTRDKQSHLTLYHIQLLENVIKNNLEYFMSQGLFYKDIYKKTVETFNNLAVSAGFSVLKQLNK